MPRTLTKKSKAIKSPATNSKKVVSKVKKTSTKVKRVPTNAVKTKTVKVKKAAKKVAAKKTAAIKIKTIVANQPSIKPVESISSNSGVSVGTKNIYLSNKELLLEVRRAKKLDVMTNQLARMLQLLCGKYAKKGNFVNYTYNEDMQAYAMMMLVRTWKSFDPEKSNNPFAFFTQCIKNSFIQYLNQEKRQRNVRDLLLVDQGMNPSFGFADGLNDKHFVDDEEDYQAMQELIKSKTATLDDILSGTDDIDDPISPVIHIDPSTLGIEEANVDH